MLIIIISIALLALLISWIDLRKIYLAFKIPGPFPLPFIGSGLMFLNKTSAEIYKINQKLFHDYGDIVSVWVKSDFHVLLTDPNVIEVLLTSQKFIEKSTVYRFLQPWLNDGLLLSKGSKWFQRRKILTPAFHFKILEQFMEIFDRQGDVFIETLSQYREGDKVELFPLVTLCALDIICESSMGTQINAQRNAYSDYVLAVKKISHVIHLRMFSFLYRYDFLYQFSSLYKEEKKLLKVLHDFTDKVIVERREAILNTDNDTSENFDESIGQKKKMTFLDILLQANIDGKPLSNLDIREEVDTFMFEGHDTTTSALTFCLYCIAKYPNVQMKCFQEIRDILGDDRTTPVSINLLNSLSYMDLVIKETLRLYPSVPYIGRLLQEEIVVGDYTFPKGTNMLIGIPYLARIEKLFPNAEEFQPERFIEEKSTKDSNFFTYIPFSAGPRNCIGQRFAVLEVKSLVSKVLRHFEISLANDNNEHPTLLAELILIPENKINFHLKPRLY